MRPQREFDLTAFLPAAAEHDAGEPGVVHCPDQPAACVMLSAREFVFVTNIVTPPAVSMARGERVAFLCTMHMRELVAVLAADAPPELARKLSALRAGLMRTANNSPALLP